MFDKLDDAYSVEFWFWNGLPADARDGMAHLCCYASTERRFGDSLVVLAADQGARVLDFSNGRGETRTGKTPILSRRWYHVVLVRDARRVTVYLNANRQPEINGDAERPPKIDGSWYFAGFGSESGHFEGKLDDIAYYARALEFDEVSRHYKAAGFGANETPAGD